MGQSKTGGYEKVDVLSDEQRTLLKQILNYASSNGFAPGGLQDKSNEAIKQFLPGGTGFNPIQEKAQSDFQQNTIPSILNAFGSNNKSSSALNQALASAGSHLNQGLAAQLAQMQLQAASQGTQSTLATAGLGLGKDQYALAQNASSRPFWQDALIGGIGAAGQIGASYFGK